jgi:hypothetical protein
MSQSSKSQPWERLYVLSAEALPNSCERAMMTRVPGAVALVASLVCGETAGCSSDASPAVETGTGSGTCAIVASLDGQMFRGYSIGEPLPQGIEMTPGATLVDSHDSAPSGKPSATYRVKGVDVRTAFVMDAYEGIVVCLAVPIEEAPRVIRQDVG